MKYMTITFEIFPFDELSKEAQQKAIDNYIEFLVETADISSPEIDPDLKRAILTAERMQTPWFTGSYVWDYCQEWILRDLKDDIWYLANGEEAMVEGQSVVQIQG